MKKAICVINTFFNYEHIQRCFNSIYSSNVDFFILENKSKYSDKIKDFFIDKNVLGYLQFKENVTHFSVDTFLKEYRDLIFQYEYLIITDGDIEIENIEDTYNEIFNILNEPNVIVCTVDLLLDNLPTKRFPESVNWVSKSINNGKFLIGNSGTHLLTVKNNNFDVIFENNAIMDTIIYQSVLKRHGIWARTLTNKAYHLTWDYYVEGNEYLEWKLKNQWTLGSHNKKSEYIKII